MRALATTLVLVAACGGASAEDGTAAAPASSGSASSSASAACSPIGGPYERGKGGGAPVCCAGLNTVDLTMPAEGPNGVRTCVAPPGNARFACITGSCGDGKCEPAESGECGSCPADCR